MLTLFLIGGLSPMRTPKSFTGGRAVHVRVLCPWFPHCEHRLGPSPAPPPPGGAAGGTPSRVMAGLGLWILFLICYYF
jgi:hypothetical protein